MKKVAMFIAFITSIGLSSYSCFTLKAKETYYCKLFIVFSMVFLSYSDIYANTYIYNSVTYNSSVNRKNKKHLYADSSISDTLVVYTAKVDAKKNFNNFGENAIVWVINLLLTPLIGWAIVLAILRKPLTEKQIKIPNNIYSNDKIYRKAYISEYNNIRKKRLWANFGIYLALYIIVVGLLIAAIKNTKW
jgi:hypothetical protein